MKTQHIQGFRWKHRRHLLGVLVVFWGLFGFVFAQNVPYNEGIRLFQKGQYAQAAIKFEEALRQNPQNNEAYRALAFCYLQSKNTIRAEATLTRGLLKFPKDLRLKSLQADIWLQSGKLMDAKRILEEIDEALGKGAKVEGFGRAQIRAQLGAIAQRFGGLAYQAQKRDEAMRQFKLAVQYLPDSLSARHNLIVLHLEEGAWEEALQASEEALGKWPNNSQLLQMKGKCLLELRRYKEMEETWKVVYDRSPRNLDVGLMYGQILLANQKNSDAQAVFDKLLRENPKEKRLYDALVQINEQGFNYTAVLELLRRQRKIFPQDPGIVKKLAQTHEITQEWEKSRAYYDSLAVLTGAAGKAKLAIARTYELQDSLAVALEKLEALRSSTPKDPEVLNALGALQRRMKRWQEAATTYATLATDTTQATAAWVRWGEMQANLGHKEEAQRGYLSALDKLTQHPLPYIGLAELATKDDPKQCEWAETGLRKALRGVKALQEQQVSQVQNRSVEEAENRQSTKEALEEYDALGGRAFQFFTTTCPQASVEGVITDLLHTYQGSGKLFYYVGTHYRRMGEIERARIYFNEAANFAPQLTENQEALGELYRSEGNLPMAILAYERILTVKPDFAPAHRALIDLYRAQGQLNALADKWLARHEAIPNNVVLREHLIEALHKAGRLEEARRIAEKVQAEKPKTNSNSPQP